MAKLSLSPRSAMIPSSRETIVLVASKAEGLMVHRVIEVQGCGPGMRIVTKGDASQSADKPTGRDEILGK